MKKNNATVSTALSALLFCTLSSNVGAAFIDTQAQATFSAFLQERIARGDTAGMAVALVEGAQTVFAQGFGVRNVDTGEAVNTETLFHIGSTNKALTSMLAAVMVDEGKLGWDQKVVDVYPAFAVSDAQYSGQIAVRQLMNMTSGVNADAAPDFDLSRPASEIFDIIQQTPLLGAPGTAFSYSNFTSAASGYISVIASYGNTPEVLASLHSGYTALMKEKLFTPIGMNTATFSVTAARINPNHSKSHTKGADGRFSLAVSEDVETDALAPSGGIKTHVLDMARFLSTEIRRGITPDGVRLVSETNLKERWKAVPNVSNGGNYGMGWQTATIDGIELISHNGTYDNFNAEIGFYPAINFGFVILTNSANSESYDMVKTIIRELEQILATAGAFDNVTPTLPQLRFSGIKTGGYVSGESMGISVSESNQGTARNENVDLWVAVQMPDGSLLFRGGMEYLSQQPQALLQGVNAATTTHTIIQLPQLSAGIQGIFKLYALYVKAGSNPLTQGIANVQRSNLLVQDIFINVPARFGR